MNIWKGNTKKSKKGQGSGVGAVAPVAPSTTGLGARDDEENVATTSSHAAAAAASGLPDVLLSHVLAGNATTTPRLVAREHGGGASASAASSLSATARTVMDISVYGHHGSGVLTASVKSRLPMVDHGMPVMSSRLASDLGNTAPQSSTSSARLAPNQVNYSTGVSPARIAHDETGIYVGHNARVGHDQRSAVAHPHHSPRKHDPSIIEQIAHEPRQSARDWIPSSTQFPQNESLDARQPLEDSKNPLYSGARTTTLKSGSSKSRSSALQTEDSGTCAGGKNERDPGRSRNSQTGVRYRSVSSEPRAKERLHDRRTRCSSANRVRGASQHYYDVRGDTSQQPSAQHYTSYPTQQHQQVNDPTDDFQRLELSGAMGTREQGNVLEYHYSSGDAYHPQASGDTYRPDHQDSVPLDCGQLDDTNSHLLDTQQESHQAILYHEPYTLQQNDPTYNPHQPSYNTIDTSSSSRRDPKYDSHSRPSAGLPSAQSELQYHHSPPQQSSTDQQPQGSSSGRSRRGRGAGEYGYQVTDLEGLLCQSSAAHPANLPMVLAAPTRLHHMRRTHASASRPFLPLGVIVNAVFKTRDWLYVRTAHGAEGFVPYHVCLPLGILPTTGASFGAGAPGACAVPSSVPQVPSTPAAWELPSASAIGNISEETLSTSTLPRGRCRERRRQQQQQQQSTSSGSNQTDMQKLQPNSQRR